MQDPTKFQGHDKLSLQQQAESVIISSAQSQDRQYSSHILQPTTSHLSNKDVKKLMDNFGGLESQNQIYNQHTPNLNKSSRRQSEEDFKQKCVNVEKGVTKMESAPRNDGIKLSKQTNSYYNTLENPVSTTIRIKKNALPPMRHNQNSQENEKSQKGKNLQLPVSNRRRYVNSLENQKGIHALLSTSLQSVNQGQLSHSLVSNQNQNGRQSVKDLLETFQSVNLGNLKQSQQEHQKGNISPILNSQSIDLPNFPIANQFQNNNKKAANSVLNSLYHRQFVGSSQLVQKSKKENLLRFEAKLQSEAYEKESRSPMEFKRDFQVIQPQKRAQKRDLVNQIGAPAYSRSNNKILFKSRHTKPDQNQKQIDKSRSKIRESLDANHQRRAYRLSDYAETLIRDYTPEVGTQAKLIHNVASLSAQQQVFLNGRGNHGNHGKGNGGRNQQLLSYASKSSSSFDSQEDGLVNLSEPRFNKLQTQNAVNFSFQVQNKVDWAPIELGSRSDKYSQMSAAIRLNTQKVISQNLQLNFASQNQDKSGIKLTSTTGKNTKAKDFTTLLEFQRAKKQSPFQKGAKQIEIVESQDLQGEQETKGLYQSVNIESLETIQGEFADSKERTLLIDRGQFQSKLSNIKIDKNNPSSIQLLQDDFNDREMNVNQSFRRNADLSALSQDLYVKEDSYNSSKFNRNGQNIDRNANLTSEPLFGDQKRLEQQDNTNSNEYNQQISQKDFQRSFHQISEAPDQLQSSINSNYPNMGLQRRLFEAKLQQSNQMLDTMLENNRNIHNNTASAADSSTNNNNDNYQPHNLNESHLSQSLLSNLRDKQKIMANLSSNQNGIVINNNKNNNGSIREIRQHHHPKLTLPLTSTSTSTSLEKALHATMPTSQIGKADLRSPRYKHSANVRHMLSNSDLKEVLDVNQNQKQQTNNSSLQSLNSVTLSDKKEQKPKSQTKNLNIEIQKVQKDKHIDVKQEANIGRETLQQHKNLIVDTIDTARHADLKNFINLKCQNVKYSNLRHDLDEDRLNDNQINLEVDLKVNQKQTVIEDFSGKNGENTPANDELKSVVREAILGGRHYIKQIRRPVRKGQLKTFGRVSLSPKNQVLSSKNLTNNEYANGLEQEALKTINEQIVGDKSKRGVDDLSLEKALIRDTQNILAKHQLEEDSRNQANFNNESVQTKKIVGDQPASESASPLQPKNKFDLWKNQNGSKNVISSIFDKKDSIGKAEIQIIQNQESQKMQNSYSQAKVSVEKQNPHPADSHKSLLELKVQKQQDENQNLKYQDSKASLGSILMSDNCLSNKQLLLPQPSNFSLKSKQNENQKAPLQIEKDSSVINISVPIPNELLKSVQGGEIKQQSQFTNPKNKSFYYKQPMLQIRKHKLRQRYSHRKRKQSIDEEETKDQVKSPKILINSPTQTSEKSKHSQESDEPVPITNSPNFVCINSARSNKQFIIPAHLLQGKVESVGGKSTVINTHAAASKYLKSNEKFKELKSPILALENRKELDFGLQGVPVAAQQINQNSLSLLASQVPTTGPNVILQLIPHHDYPSDFLSTQEILQLENSQGGSTLGPQEKLLQSVRKVNENFDLTSNQTSSDDLSVQKKQMLPYKHSVNNSLSLPQTNQFRQYQRPAKQYQNLGAKIRQKLESKGSERGSKLSQDVMPLQNDSSPRNITSQANKYKKSIEGNPKDLEFSSATKDSQKQLHKDTSKGSSLIYGYQQGLLLNEQKLSNESSSNVSPMKKISSFKQIQMLMQEKRVALIGNREIRPILEGKTAMRQMKQNNELMVERKKNDQLAKIGQNLKGFEQKEESRECGATNNSFGASDNKQMTIFMGKKESSSVTLDLRMMQFNSRGGHSAHLPPASKTSQESKEEQHLPETKQQAGHLIHLS